jgi:anti-sigma factor RsiW
VSDKLNHPSEDRLEAYVEDTLDGAARSALESHLATCAGVETEVAELRSLFEALASLPELVALGGLRRSGDEGRARAAPAARPCQRLGRAAHAQYDRGWAMATAVLAMPVLASAALVWWMLSQPGVSAQEPLALVASSLPATRCPAGWQWLWMTFAGSSARHLDGQYACWKWPSLSAAASSAWPP